MLPSFVAQRVAPSNPTARRVLSDIDDDDRLTDKSSRSE